MLVHIRLPAPLGVRILDVAASTPASSLAEEWGPEAYIRTRAGLVSPDTPISDLAHASNPDFPVDLEVCARILGGKGGFGANLRAAGGRMNASKSTNFDSCRDLNGRRLGTIKEAQKQSDLIESLPELQAKAAAESKAKLEALERKLGVSSDEIGAKNGDGSKRLAEVDVEELARKKHKFDDNKFIEESREIKENVRSAVGAALLKKRKKKAAEAAKDSTTAKPKAAATAKKTETKAAMPPPKVATVA